MAEKQLLQRIAQSYFLAMRTGKILPSSSEDPPPDLHAAAPNGKGIGSFDGDTGNTAQGFNLIKFRVYPFIALSS